MNKMSKRVTRIGVAAVCAGVIIISSQTASARTKKEADGSAARIERKETARERRLVGQVLSIDKEAHTMVVRELGSSNLYIVHVPKGETVNLSQTSATSISRSHVEIERMMQGLIVDLSVA
jgi:hypothetical protein